MATTGTCDGAIMDEDPIACAADIHEPTIGEFSWSGVVFVFACQSLENFDCCRLHDFEIGRLSIEAAIKLDEVLDGSFSGGGGDFEYI